MHRLLGERKPESDRSRQPRRAHRSTGRGSETSQRKREKMNTNGLAKHYDRLTPFDRCRLYLAAIDRGDSVERHRVLRAAGACVRTAPDHTPHLDALCALSEWFFMDLLETAALFNDALTCGTSELDEQI